MMDRMEEGNQLGSDYIRVPDGYGIIANRTVLMLMKSGKTGETDGVYAACRLEDGSRELLRRFYAQEQKRQSKEGT